MAGARFYFLKYQSYLPICRGETLVFRCCRLPIRAECDALVDFFEKSVGLHAQERSSTMDNASQSWDIQRATADGDPKRPQMSAVTLLIAVLVVVFFLIPAAGYLVSEL